MEKDPRLLVIPRRLESVKRIIAVMSSKGGVGKTIISTLLALYSSRRGLSTGLLDLDFTNPSTHIVLGIDPGKLEIVEEKGIKPPRINGVEYMSIALFTRDNPSPLRGEAIDDAFREILAITRWGRLDVLFIDTPPGIGDIHLNLLSYLGDKTEILLVATPSPLAIKSVERLITILLDGGYRIIGLIENMSNNKYLDGICGKHGVRHLGNIPFIQGIDGILGDRERLLRNNVIAESIEVILDKIL